MPTSKDFLAFEDNLKVGDRVHVRWTNSGHAMAARGTVARVSERAIRVALDSDVPVPFHTGQVWPAGFEIIAPRYFSERWSTANRVEPVERYPA